MGKHPGDRNLLFGVLAVQAGLLDPEQFVQGCTLWASRKEGLLADVLVEHGLLSVPQRDLVEQLLESADSKPAGGAPPGEPSEDAGERTLLQAAGPERVERPTAAYEPQQRERYTLTRLHARGGLGQVWLARDSDLGREVALKELRPERAGNADVRSRFLEEARITGQLEHPAIVPVYELVRGQDTQKPFYTMRFVRGRTLGDAVDAYHQKRREGQARRMALRELLNAFATVCNAIAYAHARGVIHRDLKPHNIVLGDYGEVVVLDWGLAKVMSRAEPSERSPDATPPLFPVVVEHDAARDHTVEGQVLGTPAYLSPEQAEGRMDLVNERSDVYSLGAVLYEILTGAPPFAGEDTQELLKRVVADAPLSPRQRVPAVPPALEAICLKALAKDPRQRYSAQELAREVQRWLADEPVNAYPEPLADRLGRWVRRHRGLAVGMYTVLVLLMLVVFWVARGEQLQEQSTRQAAVLRVRAEKTSQAHELEKAEILTQLARECRNAHQTDRAQAALQQALNIFDRLAPTQSDGQVARATALALAGDHVRAAEEIREALTGPALQAQTLYDAAAALALTAAAAGKDASQSPSDRARSQDRQAREAVAVLHRALAAGFKFPEQILRDTDLDSLRQRKDFRDLVQRLGAGAIDQP